MIKPNFKIVTERCILEPLAKEHLLETFRMRNNDLIRIHFTNSDQITIENHHSWFQKYLAKNDDIIWVVKEKSNSHIMAQIAAYKIQKGVDLEIGRIMCSLEYQGKGYMKEVIKSLLIALKTNLEIKNIYLYVLEENLKACQLYKGLGFEITESDMNRHFKMQKNM